MGRNRQPELWAAALIPYTAAAMALALRLISRHRSRHGFVWEDYLAVVAFLTGSAFTFISIYKMRWGLGKPLEDIDMPKDEIFHHYFLDLWVDMWFYTFSVGLSKFVILGFYWRTFSLSITRQPIRVLFVCSAAWIVVRVTLISTQCQPIQKFWNRDGYPHFILEIAILLCPLIEICRLHISTARQFAVAAMFASGLLVCGSALGTIVHTAALDRKNNQDLTYDGLDDQIWAVCDVNLASFATSLPLLRPILRSCGGVLSGIRSGSAPSAPSTYFNTNTVPTVGSAPKKRRNRPLTFTSLDAESVAELAGGFEEEQPGNSSRLYAMRGGNGYAGLEEVVRDAVYVQRETRVDVSNV